MRRAIVSQTAFYPDWREKVAFSAEGPQRETLLETDQVRVILAGLEAGQRIPPHAEGAAVYSFLDGAGSMIVDGERFAVRAGTIVVTAAGATRGVEADTRLVFLATRVAQPPDD